MRDDSDRLIEIGTFISDGKPLDWNRAESAASDAERAVIQELKVIEVIARFHGHEDPFTESAGPDSQEQTSLQARTDMTTHEQEQTAPTQRPSFWKHLELREQIGAGAFGIVYRAWESTLDRDVALKLLNLEMGEGSKELAGRILKEGKLLARVRHPNVVTVYGAEVHEGQIGIWMEHIRGRTLEDLLKEQGPFGAREAALIGLDLCRALTAVHQASLVHGDVKANNVMREAGGRILLMDFGAGTETRETLRGTGGQGIAGTPFYMAPEIFRGEVASPQSDVYSLGVLLYHLVTRKYPVEGGSLKRIIEAHDQGEVRLLREVRPDLPEPFVRVVEKALVPTAGERFASAGQMEQALVAALGLAGAESEVGPRTQARRLGRSRHHWVGLFAAAVAGIILVAWSASRIVTHRGTSPDASHGSWRPGTGGVQKEPPTSSPTSSSPGTPPGANATKPAVPSQGQVAGTYTVDALLCRNTGAGLQPLAPGARVAPGDGLCLQFWASESLHVYVVNEDDQGEAYLLFPLPGFETTNPLAPGVRHLLPGKRAGKALDWEVSSAGGREHFLLVASRVRLIEFESDMQALAPADEGAPNAYKRLSDDAKHHLRGVGGLKQQPKPTGVAAPLRLFELASRLAGSEIVRGVWIREIDLENPTP